MRKRLKRSNALSCCSSPHCNHPPPRSAFSWYEEDVWTYIARFLDGKSLVMLALTNKWFHSVTMHDSVWKFACLRDLQVPDPGRVAFSWFKLYACAFDGSHSYLFHQQDRHLGTMQMLDARHIELFLSERFKNGSWKYELIGTHKIEKNTQGACGAIFDLKHIKDSQSAGVFNLNTWMGKPDDLQPKAIIAFHGVAVNTNLQKNDGILVKYHAMRDGTNGDIVSIRISQQLL